MLVWIVDGLLSAVVLLQRFELADLWLLIGLLDYYKMATWTSVRVQAPSAVST